MNRKCIVLASLLLIVLPALALARSPFLRADMVDTDELIKRLGKFVEDNPNNAKAAYSLGRVYYTASTLKLSKIGVNDWSNGVANPTDLDRLHVLLDIFYPGKPTREPWGGYGIDVVKGQDLGVDENGKPWAGGIAMKEVPAHFAWRYLNNAIPNFRQAVKLDPNNARYHLSLACAWEDYADGKLAEGQDAEGGMTPADARKAAMEEFRFAYDLTIKDDMKLTVRPVQGLHSVVSYEAAKGYLRIASHFKPTIQQQKDAEEIGKEITAFEHLDTPQIF